MRHPFYYAKKIKINGECDTNKNHWGVIHMSSSIQFMKDLEKGKVREELFMAWCDNRGLKYLDVRDDEDYRAIDVDFLIHDIFSDTYIPIDVKCCSLKKGAIMVEMTSGKYGNSGEKICLIYLFIKIKKYLLQVIQVLKALGYARC